MRYTGTLDGNEITIVLLFGFIFFAVIFWLIPAIHRRVEKQNIPLYSLRAIVSFGQKYGVRMVGSFYRVTAYNDFLIIVFWWSEVINYRDIQKLKMNEGISSNLSMEVNNMPIRIYGDSDNLEELRIHIQKRKNSPPA